MPKNEPPKSKPPKHASAPTELAKLSLEYEAKLNLANQILDSYGIPGDVIIDVSKLYIDAALLIYQHQMDRILNEAKAKRDLKGPKL